MKMISAVIVFLMLVTNANAFGGRCIFGRCFLRPATHYASPPQQVRKAPAEPKLKLATPKPAAQEDPFAVFFKRITK